MAVVTDPGDFAVTWTRGTDDFLRRYVKVRFAALIPITLLLAASLRWDPAPWRLWGLAAAFACTLALGVAGVLQLRRGRLAPRFAEGDAAAGLVVLTAVMALTGGLEGPMVVIPPAAAMLIALHPARLRRAPLLLALLAATAIVPGVLALVGRGPPVPPFFLPGEDGARPAYVAVVTVLLCAGTIAMGALGLRLREAFEDMVRQATRARGDSVAALLDLNREVVAASSVLAHELKNPLASLQGLAQLMARGAAPGSKEHERLTVMLREIGRVREAVDGFRDLTRPLTGLEIAPARLDALVREVALLQEGQAEGRGVSLRVRADLPVSAECDVRKLKQALVNLVQNSLEAARPGDQVELAAEVASGGAARLVVRDSGPGLSDEARRNLFVPGFTTKPRGSGIGLLVARQAAQQHGGGLALEGAQGGGCVAILTLPLAAPGGSA